MDFDNIKNANIDGRLKQVNDSWRWYPTDSASNFKRAYKVEACPQCGGVSVELPGKSTPYEQSVIYKCIDARTDCNFDFERLL